jgi:hypothetical protein
LFVSGSIIGPATHSVALRLQREDQSRAVKGGAISQASIDRTELSLFLLFGGAEDVLDPE